MNIQISIIIVNYNTAHLLDDCLESLLSNKNKPECEIIVVDNNSQDNTLDLLQKKYPSVITIYNNYNAGFSKANNQGIHAARGKYVFLLNPDTIVLPEALSSLHSFMENNPQCGACGPRTWLDINKTLEVCPLKILTPDRATILFTELPVPGKNKVLRDVWNHDASAWTATSPYPVEGIGGAAILMRKDRLLQIGGLDESFFMGYEDTDLCASLAQQDLQVYVVPQSEIVHLFGQAKILPEAPSNSVYSWNAAPLFFIKKHYGNSAGHKLKFLKALDKTRQVFSGLTHKHQNPPIMENNVTLEWPSIPNSRYIFELSNDYNYFDKFGKALLESRICLPKDLLLRLNHINWFWRAWLYPVNPDAPTLASGSFVYKK